MTRRRGEVTAEEYLARRVAGPVLRAQDEAAAARHAALVDEFIRAQQPLVDDLNVAGANVASVWDLVSTRDAYPHLVPVLIEHLPRVTRQPSGMGSREPWRCQLRTHGGPSLSINTSRPTRTVSSRDSRWLSLPLHRGRTCRA